MKSLKIPNLFIVGYPKTSSTSIFDTLSKHPKICPAKNKEPGDWQELKNFEISDDNENTKNYLLNFEHCVSQKYIMEGSTRYILNLDSAFKIKKFSPNAKIIIGLREPLSYVSSLCFQIEKNTGNVKNVEEDIINHASYTNLTYYDSVNNYLDCFSAESIKIYIFEELLEDNQKIINEILDFLNLENTFDYQLEQKNISRQGKTATHRKVYSYLVYGQIPANIRRFFKKFGFYTPKYLSNFLINFFTKKVDYKQKISPEVALSFRKRYYEDIKMLSKIINKDLLTIWKYDKL